MMLAWSWVDIAMFSLLLMFMPLSQHSLIDFFQIGMAGGWADEDTALGILRFV